MNSETPDYSGPIVREETKKLANANKQHKTYLDKFTLNGATAVIRKMNNLCVASVK